jgi:PEP-CTERM motif
MLRKLTALAFATCTLALTGVAHADTIGNSLSGDNYNSYPYLDGCPNCGYVVGQSFSTAGQRLVSYSFYSQFGGGEITPELFTGVDNGNNTITFTAIGIGTTQTSINSGINTFAFGLTSGTDITGAHTFFGFYNANGANVWWNNTGDPSKGTYLLGGALGLGGQGTASTTFTWNTFDALNNRAYAIEATAVPAATPEPTSMLLLATGTFGFCGRLVRKNRSR